MIDLLVSHYAYFFVVILAVTGLYGILLKRNLVKKLIGLSIFQTSIILFFVASAAQYDATIPIVGPGHDILDPALFANPLPHTLMLTAIVVSVATTGVALALLISIYKKFGTLDEPLLLERMK